MSIGVGLHNAGNAVEIRGGSAFVDDVVEDAGLGPDEGRPRMNYGLFTEPEINFEGLIFEELGVLRAVDEGFLLHGETGWDDEVVVDSVEEFSEIGVGRLGDVGVGTCVC